MLCFEVTINGKQHCLAGSEETVVLSLILNWLRRTDRVDLSVGALLEHDDATEQHVDWIEQHDLAVGDEITIRVIDSPEPDEPVQKGEKRPRETCSFCSRRKSEVAKIIAGPHVYICDKCTSRFLSAISDDSLADKLGVTFESGETSECSFCGRARNQVARLVRASEALICDVCLETCDRVIAGDVQ
nr:putative integron gene cassette protein [uncultured bacterium]